MKNLINNKWAWAVLALIIINIATIGAMWCSMCRSHHRGHDMDHHRHEGGRGDKHSDHKPGDFLSRELHLTPAQEKSFEELRTEHFEKIKTNFEEMKVLKKEVIENLGKPEADIDPVLQKIGALEITIQKETFEHFNKMYALCTDSQKVQLKEKLSNMMERRGRKGYSRHGGYGGGGHKSYGHRGECCAKGTCSKGKEEVEADSSHQSN
jgi:protein CpxP